MNLDYSSIFKNFQSVIGSYQDIGAIYTKLFSQGQIQKLGAVINEIYDEEHVFTLTELQRYCRDANQNEDNFVAEQYEMNSTIFRRNLSLIVQNLVDEIGKKYLERFRQDYLSTSGPEVNDLPSEIPEQLSRENSDEKSPQQRSYQPEVAEPVEHVVQKPAYVTPAKTSSKSLIPEADNASTGNRSFDINMTELAQKAKIQQIDRTPPSYSANDVDNRVPRQHNGDRSHQNSTKKVTYANYEGAEKASPAYTKAEASTIAFSEARVEDFSQYENESGTLKQSQGRVNNAARYKNVPDVNNFWSSSERGSGNSRKNFYSNNRRDVNVSSPERLQTLSNSMFGGSYSRWSTSNGRPDMSILDSEFSYGQGQSFSKSPKKFHHNIQDIPGPGRYELEESMQMTKSKSPIPSFPKSPKVPCYFKKSTVPGAIYYPTIHFASK